MFDYYYYYYGSGLKLSWKLEQVLEWLHFVLGGCAGEDTEDSDRICSVELKPIVTEGALAIVICALCDVPSKFVIVIIIIIVLVHWSTQFTGDRIDALHVLNLRT